MNKWMFPVAGLLVATLLAGLAPAPAAAITNDAFAIAMRSDRSFVDTLGWKRHSGTTGICTLSTGKLRDTSEVIPLTNLRWLAATNALVKVTSTGAKTLTCSLEVSQNGTKWFRPVAQPRFSRVNKAVLTNQMRVWFADTEMDSILGQEEVAGLTAMNQIAGCRLGRFNCVATENAQADSTIFVIVTHRAYRKR